jgi:hypothetical protein
MESNITDNQFDGIVYSTPTLYKFTVPSRTNSVYLNEYSYIEVSELEKNLTNDFTFEFWVYSTVSTVDSYEIISSANNEFTIYKVKDFNKLAVRLQDSNTKEIIQQNESFTNNSWHHIVVERCDNILTLYVDGVDVGNLVYLETIKLAQCNIRVSGNKPVSFSGYISNLRLITDSAVYYTPNYDIPQNLFSNESDSYYDNTVLHLSLTEHDANFVDISPYANTVLNTNTGSYSAEYKFFDSSASFNDNSELKIIDNKKNTSANFFGNTSIDFDLIELSNDYTVECWVNISNVNSNCCVIGYLHNNINQQLISIVGGELHYYSNGLSLSSNTVIVSDRWYHLAVTRSSGTIRIFVDGVINGSIVNNDINYIKHIGKLGSDSAGNILYALNGKVSNVRVIKDSAIYTSNFTPLDKPLPKTINTVLLTAQHPNLFVDNSDLKNKITRNITSASITYPFNSSIFDFGTEDYTIECWAYLAINDLKTRSVFTAHYQNNKTLEIRLNNSEFGNQFGIVINDGSNTSVYLTDLVRSESWFKSWNFISIQRRNKILTCYINGVQQSIRQFGNNKWARYCVDNTNYSNCESLIIGKNWNGYLQDVRITRGVARNITVFKCPITHLTPILNTSLLIAQYSVTENNSSKNANLQIVNAQNSDKSPFSITTAVDILRLENTSNYNYSVALQNSTTYQNSLLAKNLKLLAGTYNIAVGSDAIADATKNSIKCLASSDDNHVIAVKYISNITESIYNQSGNFKYVVPDGVFFIDIECRGAPDRFVLSNGATSVEDYVYARTDEIITKHNMTVKPGQQLNIVVGASNNKSGFVRITSGNKEI